MSMTYLNMAAGGAQTAPCIPYAVAETFLSMVPEARKTRIFNEWNPADICRFALESHVKDLLHVVESRESNGEKERGLLLHGGKQHFGRAAL
jgi:hypothetical protein